MTIDEYTDLHPAQNLSSAEHHHHGHQHSHRGKQRLLQFVHPHTGKNIHVAHTPEELYRKKKDFAHDDEKGDDFDVVLHGSPEHLDMMHELRAHHSSAHDDLKQEHADTFSKFQAVQNQLDLIDAELHLLTDDSVALDASFDKFGYSARLRTLDHADSDVPEMHSTSMAVAEQQDRTVNPFKFFKKPQIRQYFHKGLVWRSSKPGEVASFELFIDLVYVGVIDIIGEKAVESATGLSLLHFCITMSIAAKIWTDMTMIINFFDMDDIFQRISFAFYLVCLSGYTINMTYMFEDEETTYKSAIAFYITSRLFVGLWYLLVAILVPMIRGTALMHVMIITTSATLWIGSMHAEWPGQQLPLIWVAIPIDLFGNISLLALSQKMRFDRGRFRRWLGKYFEFWPSINIEHRVERNDAFIALVFGYSVLTILYQSSASFGINAFFGKAILGLLQAFTFNWIYFEIDSYGVHTHAIRRHYISATGWITLHLPFVMSYVLAAAMLSRIVLAHDCPNSPPSHLSPAYEEHSVEMLSSGQRWFYCSGLGVAMLCMTLISLCHVHKSVPNSRLTKTPRLIIRACVAVVIMTLPTAGDSLNSLHLVAITSCLTIGVLMIDIYGNTSPDHNFWGGGDHKRKVHYTADVKISGKKRKELREALQKGHRLGVKDLLHRRNSSKVGLEGRGSGISTPVKDEEWHGGHY